MGRVAAILSDFDGTLCPTSDIKYDYNRSEFIPRSLEDILCEVSSTIPISIVTSKDFDFIYPKTKKFAKILSCILGLETFVINDKEQINQDKNISYDNKKLLLEDVIVTDRISTCDHEILTINSNILSEIAVYVEKNYKKINIEKKSLKSENLLGGITVDWRHNSNWMVNKEKYKEIVKKSISIVLNNASTKKRRRYIKRKISLLCSESFYPGIY